MSHLLGIISLSPLRLDSQRDLQIYSWIFSVVNTISYIHLLTSVLNLIQCFLFTIHFDHIMYRWLWQRKKKQTTNIQNSVCICVLKLKIKKSSHYCIHFQHLHFFSVHNGSEDIYSWCFQNELFSLPCKINVPSPKWDSSILFLSSFRCFFYCSWHVHKRLHSKTLRELMPCPNGNFSWFNVIVRMNCECVWMCVGIWLIWFSFGT